MLPARLVEHLVERHGFRHDHRLVQDGPQIEGIVKRHAASQAIEDHAVQVLGVKDAHNVVRRVVVSRHAGVLVFNDALEQQVQVLSHGKTSYFGHGTMISRTSTRCRSNTLRIISSCSSSSSPRLRMADTIRFTSSGVCKGP